MDKYVALLTTPEVAFIALLGGVSGGLIGALLGGVTWWLGLRDSVARYLLAEAMRIQALREAWVVTGEGAATYELTSATRLPFADTFADEGQLALYRVEVRAALDRPEWSLPEQLFHTFIDGRRTWIVRPKLKDALAYGGYLAGARQDSRPAVLSSHALEELVAWVEQVASARSWRSGFLLSSRGLRMLLVLLPAVAAKDRIQVFEKFNLSNEAKAFLNAYRRKHPLPAQETAT